MASPLAAADPGVRGHVSDWHRLHHTDTLEREFSGAQTRVGAGVALGAYLGAGGLCAHLERPDNHSTGSVVGGSSQLSLSSHIL